MLIGGRYQVEEKLGSGGMGTVYRGVDTQTQQIVAIKQLDRQAIEMDASILERFNREGEALRELNHPNIVKILDTVEENNEHYLVIEYIAGGDLAHMLEAGPLSVRRAVELALDLTDALTRAHRLNIIHRDIKPANVLLTPNGQPRLTDFGIAHIGDKENLTRSGMMVGTIRYLPPEALSDRPVDARSDIWAFGVMLYEMLTGKHPFDGETSSSIMLNIIQQPHPDITDYRKDLPAALVNLINRMIEKDPDKRIPSVRLVGAELEKVLQLLDDPTSSTNLSDSFIQRLARHERQIFISYSSKDRSRVSGIVKQLQGMGYLVWYDQELTGGQEWWDQILTQIRNCDLFLFMVTPRSMASYPCQLERDYARALNKLIMPLVLEPVDILGDIATIQLVNYLEGDEAEVAVLKNALEKVPEGAPLPNPLPPGPSAPLRAVDEISEKINRESLPVHSEIMNITWELVKAYRDEETRSQSVRLLKQLRKHKDLKASTAEDMDEIINNVGIMLDDSSSNIRRGGTTQRAVPRFGNTVTNTPRPMMSMPMNSPTGIVTLIGVIAIVLLIGVGIFFSVNNNNTQPTPTPRRAVAAAPATQPPATTLPGVTPSPTLPPTVIPTPRQIDRLDNRANWVKSLRVSSDGSEMLMASTDGFIRVWDLGLTALKGEMQADEGSVLSVAYHPSGFTVAAGYADGAVKVWLLQSYTALPAEFNPHEGSVMAVGYDPSGEHLFSAGIDGKLRIYDLTTGTLNREIVVDNPILDAEFAPDGSAVALALNDGTIRVYPFGGEEEAAPTIFFGHTNAVWDIAYSTDGQYIISGSEDTSVRLWDAISGVELETLRGHISPVYTVAFSADGAFIASGGQDRTIQLWDANSGTKITTISTHEGPVLTVAFTPDNTRIVSGSEDGTWRLWQFRDGTQPVNET